MSADSMQEQETRQSATLLRRALRYAEHGRLDVALVEASQAVRELEREIVEAE